MAEPKSKKLQVYVGQEKSPIAMTFEDQVEALSLPTPQKYIMQRPGRGNLMLDYVEANYVIGRLNATFQFDWDVEVIDKIIDTKGNQIAMWIRLTVRFANGKLVKKDAWGSAEIKRKREDDSIIDLADDLKAAQSDGIKKAASMLNICWDVYSGHTKATQQKEEKEPESEVTEKEADDFFSNIDPPDTDEPFRNIDLTLSDGKTKKVTKYEALTYFGKVKELVGEENYYATLWDCGYEKSNQIPDKDIPKVYDKLITLWRELEELKQEGNDGQQGSLLK